MATVTIQVTDCSGSTVTMSTNGNASANAGDYVQWNVTGSKIISISISQVSGAGETQIWASPPAPFPNSTSKNWRGTIKSDADSVYEDYTITANCSGTIISHDPRISVNPKTKVDEV